MAVMVFFSFNIATECARGIFQEDPFTIESHKGMNAMTSIFVLLAGHNTLSQMNHFLEEFEDVLRQKLALRVGQEKSFLGSRTPIFEICEYGQTQKSGRC